VEGKTVGAPDIQTALDWRGRSVVDRGGEKIGTLREIYLDQSDRAAWGAIHTALFGLRQTLVPLSDARLEGDRLRLPYEQDHVKAAPNVDPDVQLTTQEEEQLYHHYGMATEQRDEPTTSAEEPGAVAVESTAREPSRDDAMTRSEEEVRIGKRTRDRERVRLKKYVVTDYVEKKVPVKREEVRLEREPPEEPDRD